MQEQKRIKNMTRKLGWSAILDDGTVVPESGGQLWSNIKERVVELCFVDDLNNVILSLPNNQQEYIQGKTGSCDVNGGAVTIEKRWIGFKSKSGETIVANVSSKTGMISVEVLNGSAGSHKTI